MDTLIEAFSLERVNKAGAKFDPEKAKWFQQQYFQQQDEDVLVKGFKAILEQKGVSSTLNLAPIITSVKERCVFIDDIWEQASFFFVAPTNYDEKASKKAFKEDTPKILQQVVSLVNETTDFSASNLSDKIKGWITSQEMGFGKVMMPFRLALVGAMKGPDVFDIAVILGKQETVKRLEKAIENLS